MEVSNLFNSGLLAIWPWLFPATYLVHMAEEFWAGGGYSAHLAKSKGVHLGTGRFLLLAALGLLLMISGILVAQGLRFPQLLMVILGTLVLLNGLSHTLSGVLSTSYNPGLISGLLIWIPLGSLTLLLLLGSMSTGRYLIGVLTGAAIQAIVSWLSSRGGRLLLS